MRFIWFVWERFVNCIEFVFLFYLLSKQLGTFPAKRKIYYLSVRGLITLTSILNECNAHYLITMAAILIADICFALLFKSSITKRIFWGCIASFVFYVGNSLLSVIMTWIPGIDIQQTLMPGPARFGVQVLYCMIIIVLFWGLSRVHIHDDLKLPRRYHFAMILVLIIGLFAIVAAIAFAIQSGRTLKEQFLLTTVSASILAMTISVIVLFEKIGSSISKTVSAEERLKQFRIEESNNQRVEKIVKAWRHDFHNYLEVLQFYSETGNHAGLQKYIGEMQKDYRETLSLIATGNSAIDAILSSKQLIAHSQSTDMKLSAQRLSSLPIGETKMCVLLGNIIDNALDACMKIDDPQKRRINIRIGTHRGMLSIFVENTTVGDYRYNDNQLISTKTEDGHGFGLERVYEIVGAANGICALNPAKDKFTVSVLLPY